MMLGRYLLSLLRRALFWASEFLCGAAEAKVGKRPKDISYKYGQAGDREAVTNRVVIQNEGIHLVKLHHTISHYRVGAQQICL